MVYIFDSSYEGLLTAVFTAFEHKNFDARLATKNCVIDLFDNQSEIISDSIKAQRVLKGLEKKLKTNQIVDFYRAFLSEDIIAWRAIFNLIIRIFQKDESILENYGDNDVLYLSQTLRKVSRERHRMKAFVRFQKDENGMYLAVVEPDFNVLPLIVPFFKNRYTDQPWLIYDLKRNYGIYYDLKTVTEVSLTKDETKAIKTLKNNVSLDEKDESYQHLWKSYFQSTNIPARKNMKLHLRHVPKRYWKYLPEKNDSV